ncbi:MAG: acyltransferase family protein [Lachnospiraceae bacterium]|nr:acyltransferase family protein [Lachnospiraceae bacterium]
MNRADRFDIAKGIGILLVVLGHLEYISEPLRYFIVSFHMPLFFVISGMLMCVVGEEKKEPARFVKGKLSRMGFPYLVYTIAYLIIEIIYGHFTGTFQKWTFIQDIWQGVCLYGISVLWFLPSMFFGMLILYFLRRKLSHKATAITVVILTVSAYGLNFLLEMYRSATVFELVLSELYYPMAMVLRSVIAVFYLAVGYYGQYLISKKKIELNAPLKIVIAVLLLGAVVFLSRVNGAVDIHFLIFGNPFIYIFNSLAGSAAVMLISSAAEKYSGTIPGRIVRYYGVNSLTVMATHINFYVLYASILLVIHLMQYITHAKGYLFCPLIVFFVFVAEAFVIEGIKILKKIVTPKEKKLSI